MGNTVDLAAAWLSFWGRITSGPQVASLVQILTWTGVAMVAFAIGKWAWSRRRGGAQAGLLGWPLFVGAGLAFPNAVLPAVLWLIDLIANTVITILH